MSRRPVDKENILLWPPLEAEWWFLALRMDMEDGDTMHAMLLIFKQSKYRRDDNMQFFFSRLLHKPLVHGFLSLFDEKRGTYTWQEVTSLQATFHSDAQNKHDAAFKFGQWSCNARTDKTFAFVFDAPDMHIEFDGLPASTQYEFHESHTIEVVSPHLQGQVRVVDTSGALLRSGIGSALYEQGWSCLTPRNLAGLDFYWAYFLLSDGSRFLFGNAPFRYITDTDGIFIDARGIVYNFSSDDIQWKPTVFYTSKERGYTYPMSWECTVEKVGLRVVVTVLFPQQEIDGSGIFSIRLFAGVAVFQGTIQGAEVTGNAYIYMSVPQRFSTRLVLWLGSIFFEFRSFLARYSWSALFKTL